MIGKRLGGYEIIEEVGMGGMATVYRAYQANMDRDVAIKVLKRNLGDDEHGLQRFQREARLIARLEHPHILPVYDFDGTHNPPYIVMRYLDSGTLRDRLKRGRLALSDASFLLGQMASALDYAHRQGVIHRDVKPANIMIDREGNAFVTDLGIARMVHNTQVLDDSAETGITNPGVMVGTPDYVSPEQAVGEADIDFRTDLYSLGVILFEMLTGELPFTAHSMIELLMKHVKAPIPNIRSINPDLPAGIETVINTVMAKERDERYESVADFSRAVADILGTTGDGEGHTVRLDLNESRITRLRRPEEFDATVQQVTQTPTEQNKLVTALTANAAEYAEIVELVEGAETAHQAMNTLWNRLTRVVNEHDGQVIERSDDRLLALWGAETASETDPERAIRSALSMLTTMREVGAPYLDGENDSEPLPLKIGVNTGNVLLSLNIESEHFQASGATVTLANRLAENADGSVLIAHDTYRHVRGIFDIEAANPLKLRGRRDPVLVYRAQTAKARPFRISTRGVEGVETAMVGRESELKQLQRAFLDAVEEDETQVVTIIAEAGIGKSRLLYEFSNWSDLHSEEFWFFEGRATPEITSQPYALLRDMLAFRFEIQDRDSTAEVQRKFEQKIAELLDGEQNEIAHMIGQLVGFDFSESPYVKGPLSDPQGFARRARQLLIRFFIQLTKRDPVVIHLEDVHHADDSSLDWLNELVSGNESLPLLVIAAARPSLLDRRPAWGSGQRFHKHITLDALDRRDSRDLVREILKKAENVPKKLRDLLVERAEGNPLYMEELVKMLIEDHVIQKEREIWTVVTDRLDPLRVPPTLVSLLQTRLDSLLYPERVVLQRAAVIGRVFYDEAVAALEEADRVSIDDLNTVFKSLMEREFIQQRENSAFATAREYIFAQSMLRDTVYDSLLRRQIQAYNTRAAQWLIDVVDDRADEYAVLVAEYYEKGEQYVLAADHLRRSGEKALSTSAFREAQVFFDRALTLLRDTNEDVDDRQRVTLLNYLGETTTALSEYDDALAYLNQAVRLAREIDHREGMLDALYHLGEMYRRQGDFAQSEASLSEALTLAREHGDRERLARVLLGAGVSATNSGTFDQAKVLFEEALPLSREVSHSGLELRILNNLGFISAVTGQLDQARDYWQSGLDRSLTVGMRHLQANFLLNLAETDRVEGDSEAARERFRQALSISREISDTVTITTTLNNLSLLAIDVGDLGEAETYTRECLKLAWTAAGMRYVLDVFHPLSALRVAQGHTKKALQYIGMALAHPACDAQTKKNLNSVLEAAQAETEETESALKAGETLDIKKVIREILAE